MIQTIKNNAVTLITALMLAFFAVALPVTVHAATTDACLKQGSNLQLNANTCPNSAVDGQTKLNQTITWVINTFSIIVGLVAVIMLIFGGFRYVTSGGDSGNIGNAKNTILYAIVGLVIVALAQAVVQFVLQNSAFN